MYVWEGTPTKNGRGEPDSFCHMQATAPCWIPTWCTRPARLDVRLLSANLFRNSHSEEILAVLGRVVLPKAWIVPTDAVWASPLKKQKVYFVYWQPRRHVPSLSLRVFTLLRACPADSQW